MLKQEILLILFLVVFSVDSIYVQLINDGPIVKGGTIHFYATVFEGNQPSTGAFKYEWEDNAINMHTRQSPMQNSTDQWTVTYEADKYPIGSYIVQVSVKTCVISEIICYEVGSSRPSFNITGTLNGNMALQQKNETIETNFVSNMDTVIHEIVLKQSDKDYIDKAPTVLTYWFMIVNGTLVPYNVSLPYICNGSVVTSGSVKAFGFFRKRVKVKAPVSNVNVTGEQLDTARGPPLFYKGAYNYTKNETCFRYKELDNNCEFPIQRYLAYNKSTVLIIIKNEVSKVITPVAVTVYKVKKQAQLSVIVVPVSFSLVAVVLIVFGIAYYIQNRSRFLIEVADFNFGQQYSDMEYKTFSERLRESIT
ncbi:hypothetical protein NQ317_002283 [Molorchus minor]|uniref:Allorecognition 2 n=1 Tax=Molorchus minor TaxID=1323400 RepID=A0ABQ9JKB5_9CUCU|nr:hypothetical protein NQ317_002283 [Molorchus minor]